MFSNPFAAPLSKKAAVTAVFAAVIMVFTALTPSFTLSAAPSGWEIDYSDSVDWNKFRSDNITINVNNWGEYIAVSDGISEDGSFDVNREFERLTGIRVNYSNFGTNEELYAKLKSGGAAYDIIIPSDYMVSRLINEGMLEKLNLANIPNYHTNIDERYKNPGYDPKNEYSVPYMWGTIGIIYNTTLVDEDDDVASWDILWNEKYANNMLMFSNSRDAFAIALLRLGYSVNSTSERELREAADSLKSQKPLVQAYVMDEIYDKMGGGEAALAPYYAGDAIVMMEDNPDLDFVIPVEGTNVFVDALCIPKGAKNKEAAEMYINFMCEALTSLKNCEYIGYSTPNAAAYQLLDDEIKENEIIYPGDDVLSIAQIFTALPDATTKLVDTLWTEILSNIGANPWMTPIILIVCVALIIYINVRRARRNRLREDSMS